MKPFYKLFPGFLLLLFASNVHAQKAEPKHMLRVYEENDFFNFEGKGTDKAYSNGTRFDFFYEKQTCRSLLHRLMPKAGDSSKNVYGFGLMQIMVTPHNIEESRYLPNDYYYAGALFATHSLYSYNAKKKYSLQTEVLAGVRGPNSFAEEVQTGFHNLIDYQKPMGWDNQLKTQLLLNVTIAAEKNLFPINDFVELNVGAQLRAGSLMDLVTFYPTLRIGKMSPYFNGFMGQYGSYAKPGKRGKTQYYFVFKPATTFIAYNAMLEGKRQNRNTDFHEYTNKETAPPINHHLADLQFGLVVAHQNVGISLLQTNTSAYNEGIDRHSYGNLSLHYRW